MPILVSARLPRVRDTLQDSAGTRWPDADLFRYYTDGQREILIHRPDASAVTASWALTTGVTKQTLPAGTVRLLSIARNMGSGSTPGGAITLIEKSVLDAFAPTWHAEAGAAEVKHYVYDPRDPLTFYVYPKPSSTLHVEGIRSTLPADITAGTDAISVADIFATALDDYVLYRAFSRDADYALNLQRAAAHYQAMANALGLKLSIDGAFGPAANSPPSNGGVK